MDAEQRRIEEDLRGQLDGRVRCDDLFTQLYATDASIYEQRPLGVVRPRHARDVAATVRYAAAHEIPIHARGAGTGLAGESLGRGLVVDFSCYMRRIGEIGDEDVVVQAGVVQDQLATALAKRNRLLGPDPATRQVSTIGGAIAIDSSGSRWPAYGSMRDQIQELEVVLADGEIVRLHRNHLTTHAENDKAAADRVAQLAAGVRAIADEHSAALAANPIKSKVDRSGYWLAGATAGAGVDLARLIAGSEGTLALVTEARLSTHARPAYIGSVLLFFNSMERAAEAAAELAERRVRACDLMDRRHLTLARESDSRYEFLIPAATEAVLLVEQAADTQDGLRYALLSVVDLIVKQRKLAVDAHLAADEYEDELLWELARRYTSTMHRLRGSIRPVPFVEDVAVPPQRLAEFLRAAQETLNHFQVTASVFGHASHGQLHIRPMIDLASPEEVAVVDDLAAALYEHVWAAGGTISGEHGEGLSRTPFVERQHGDRLAAFRAVKTLFDPAGLLNPGKKIPADKECVISRLRKVTVPQATLDAAAASEDAATREKKPTGTLDLQLAWTPAEMAHSARVCNGCGACRTQSDSARMCPIFRFSPREEASPRAKANLARGLLTGSLPGETVLEDAAKQIADLCVHCHMCRLECPANVDIPRLMVEAKAQYAANNGLPLADAMMARIDDLCRWASRAPRLANWMIRDRVARWVMEKMIGIAQGRKLPRFTRRTFLRRAAQQRLHKMAAGDEDDGREKVLLFVDTFANYCDPQLAEALVAVLRHNGVEVFVPQDQLQAGMPLVAHGLVDSARRVARKNLAVLGEAARNGYTIVSTEPSAILALTQEYPQLLPDEEDMQLVADNSLEACQYLWRLHQRGRLQLNFDDLDLTVGYHKPCHMIALDRGDPAVHLLNLIPELRVLRVDKGCSGIAGMYGFQKKNYRNSLRVGLPLMSAMRTGRFHAGTTECSTCRVQMEQGAAKPTLHPVKLLALAYGLMPEVRDLLHRPAQELVVR